LPPPIDAFGNALSGRIRPQCDAAAIEVIPLDDDSGPIRCAKLRASVDFPLPLRPSMATTWIAESAVQD
jgi:hypothetical protein